MEFKIIYEDNDLLAINKPANIVVFNELKTKNSIQKTIIDYLIDKNPELKNVGEAPRYGIIHRLDKDTSGVLLVAKSNKSLKFFQNQFINRTLEKKYIALVIGLFKDNSGRIETLIGRSPADYRKQKAYSLEDLEAKDKKNLREAITEYKVLEKFDKYTLLEVIIKTGRKHQIRCHLSYIHHPVAGDKLYGFKDSPIPENLTRQFLHASYLKIKLPNETIKELKSELSEELQKVLDNFHKIVN